MPIADRFRTHDVDNQPPALAPYDALTIPIQAVTTVRGKQVCLVKRGSSTEPVPVEVGLFNDRLIEIKAGLVEGDQVLLSPLSASDNVDMSGSLFSDDGDTNGRPAFKRDAEGTNGEPSRVHPAAHEPARTNRRPNYSTAPDPGQDGGSKKRDRPPRESGQTSGGGGSRDRGPRLPQP